MNAAITKEVQQSTLTFLILRFMLYPLSQKTKDGSRTPRKGEKSPLTSAVFLCPVISDTGLIRVKFIMVDCLRETLKSFARSFAGSTNLIQSTALLFVPTGGGLSSNKGVSAMSQSKTTKPTPDAYGVYRVNPESKPPKGFKQLCNQCHFDRFSGAYRYCPNCGAEAINYCQYVAIAGGV